MPNLRSIAQMLRVRAEQGATREELEVALQGSGNLSCVERTVLEAYVWALVKVPTGAFEAGGERGDPRP